MTTRNRVELAGTIAWCALLAGTTASAQNWPSFRGPNGSGIGTGSPPVTWNVETGENVKWKARIPGLGHSSPIVWGERVFVTTATNDKAEKPSLQVGWLGGTGDSAADEGTWTWKVLCLDRKTGRVLWEKDACSGVPKIKRHIKATHANCTPATDGKRVAALFGSEGLYCFDMDGKLLWKQDLGTFESGPYDAPGMQWGFAGSPILHDGQVIVQCDANNTAFWAAFDADTGKELRRVPRQEITTWCTPIVVQAGGRAQLVCNGFRHMGGYDLATGEELWKLQGGGDCPVPTPQVFENLILLTNGHGRSPIYAIRSDARGDLTPDAEGRARAAGDRRAEATAAPGSDGATLPAGLAWWKTTQGSYMPTPLVYDGKLYVPSDNGLLTVFDARTGEKRHRARISSGVTYTASAVAADGRLYCTSEDGDVLVLDAADPEKQLAKNSMKEVCMATPAISDGLLLIRTRDNLYCMGK